MELKLNGQVINGEVYVGFYPRLADIKTREIDPNGQAVKNPPCPLADKTD